MRTKRSADQAPSRERVLGSALEEFGTYGFAGARIDRIAQRVKLNVRMIYYHFRSKEGLYQAVLREIFPESPIPQPIGEQALVRYFEFLGQHARFADVLVRELLDGGTHLKALVAAEPSLFEGIHRPSYAVVLFLVATRDIQPLFLDRKLTPEEWVTRLSGFVREAP
jgi:AcrR family transcriptional regulator